MTVSGSRGIISGSLILHQRTDRETDSISAHPQRGSVQTAGMWVDGVGINLAVRSRVPAAPSRSQWHHDDSVDNEQSL